jgi:RNA polymerase sigma-70 factor (ECF subfamily)
MGRRPSSDVALDGAEAFEITDRLTDAESPDEVIMAQELKDVIAKAIDALPAELRSALTLREFEGLSYEEIAEVIECPIGTVRSRIFRAREAIDQRVALQLQGGAK